MSLYWYNTETYYKSLLVSKEVQKAIQRIKRGQSIRSLNKPKSPTEAKRIVLHELGQISQKHSQKRAKTSMIKWIIGIDEVGRGPLAGPVTMCAFACRAEIFKAGIYKYFLAMDKNLKLAVKFNDSKKMTSASRSLWNQFILKYAKTSKEIYFEIGSRTAEQIDKEGISNSIKKIISKMLIKLSAQKITYKNSFLTLDGSLHAPEEYNQLTFIKGDSLIETISLASILAKEHRDSYMKKIAKQFPKYGFEKHVGYGTKSHIEAIKKSGTSKVHRTTFLKNILK